MLTETIVTDFGPHPLNFDLYFQWKAMLFYVFCCLSMMLCHNVYDFNF